MRETDGSALIGPSALDSGASPMGEQPRHDRDLYAKELRANADPEDDGARESFIEAERRNEEGRR
jgi:hypothetical protein